MTDIDNDEQSFREDLFWSRNDPSGSSSRRRHKWGEFTESKDDHNYTVSRIRECSICGLIEKVIFTGGRKIPQTFYERGNIDLGNEKPECY